MAVYSRTQSIDSSNLPSLKPQIESRDLSTVIISSFENVMEKISDNDLKDVTPKNLEQSITKGINNSVIGKNIGKLSSGGTRAAGTNPQNDYFEQKKFIEWQNYLKRQEKEEQESRKQRDLAVQKAVDNTFNGVTGFFENPLKGFSDLLDKGVKSLFTGAAKTLNKPLSEVGTDLKSGIAKFAAPAVMAGKLGIGAGKGIVSGVNNVRAMAEMISGKGGGAAAPLDMNSLIAEDEKGVVESSGKGKQIKEASGKGMVTKDNVNDLITQDKSSREMEKAEEKKDKDKQLKAQERTAKATEGIGSQILKAKLGIVLLGALAIIEAIPIIVGTLGKWFANSTANGIKMRAKLEGFLLPSSSNSIFSQVYRSLGKALSQIHFPGFSFGGLSKEEKKELKDLNVARDSLKRIEEAEKNLPASIFADKKGNLKGNALMSSIAKSIGESTGQSETDVILNAGDLRTKENRDKLFRQWVSANKDASPEKLGMIYRQIEDYGTGKQYNKSIEKLQSENKKLKESKKEFLELAENLSKEAGYSSFDAAMKRRDELEEKSEKAWEAPTAEKITEEENVRIGRLLKDKIKFDAKTGKILSSSGLTQYDLKNFTEEQQVEMARQLNEEISKRSDGKINANLTAEDIKMQLKDSTWLQKKVEQAQKVMRTGENAVKTTVNVTTGLTDPTSRVKAS